MNLPPPLDACDQAAWHAGTFGGTVSARTVRVEGRLYLPVRAGGSFALARWALEGEARACFLITGPGSAPVRVASPLVRTALLRAGSEQPAPAQLAWPRMAAEVRSETPRRPQFFAGWAGNERRRTSLFRRGRADEIGPDGVFATWRMGRLPHWLEGGALVTVHRQGAWVFGATYFTGERFAAHVPVRSFVWFRQGCA